MEFALQIRFMRMDGMLGLSAVAIAQGISTLNETLRDRFEISLEFHFLELFDENQN